MNLAKLWRLIRWHWIYMGPRRTITVSTANGLLSFDSKDWLIGKYLYVRREHEDREARNAIGLLNAERFLHCPGETLLNVGANVGMTCIGLVKAGYFKRAIAFEPTPSSYRLLTRNIEQNGLDKRIECFPYALSSVSGMCRLEISKDNSGDNRIRLRPQPGFFHEERRNTIEVPARTLDQVLLEVPGLKEERIDLVWADIQGHEGHFLQGAQQFLKQRRIPVVSEFWPYGIGRSGMSRQEFCQIVSDLFTHFYVIGSDTLKRQAVSEIADLYSIYSQPRAMCLVVWVCNSR